jgi:aspartyl-tRNA(Asn)/glutamyl-tRNA(Gln) amidotransferase subunit A
MTRRAWLTALSGLTLAGPASGASSAAAQSAGAGGVDVRGLSVAGLGEALASGRLTPLDVTAAYLKAIDDRNPSLGAYVTVARERAVDETRRLMTSPATARGPLFGVPVAHKDLLATRGVRTTGGSKLYEAWVPDEDADLVSRFRLAGAVVLGKTNTHELGGGVTTINPFVGTTHNPRDLTRIPGGSSGGSAAAVVAELAPVATGSDTGGSVRIPAALCGCVGFKPTFGLLPTTGLLGACPTFDHVGWLTRTPEDAALVLEAVAPARPGVGATSASWLADYRRTVAAGIRGLRVGVARPYFFDHLEPGVRDAVTTALARLREAGATVRDVALPVDADLFDTMFSPIVETEIRARYGADFTARPEAFSKEFLASFEGPGVPDPLVARALAERAAFERAVVTSLGDVDVLAMPTVPVVAPPIAGPIDGMRILRNTWPFNAARVPAVSVPCGQGEHGLPVGLQLVARPFGDGALLGIATMVERLLTH